MPQTWNPETYGRNGAFVHELAGGVLEWLAPQPGERILDLGCGDGQLTLRIAASGASVVGIDASPAMVAAARARGVEADNGPAEKLPYPDHVFDAVFSNAVLHWVRGQDEMLSQVRRVLRPGGRFVAEMGGHGNIAAIRAAFAAVSRATDLLLSVTAAITIQLPRSTAAVWSGKDLPCRRSLTSLAPRFFLQAAWPAG